MHTLHDPLPRALHPDPVYVPYVYAAGCSISSFQFFALWTTNVRSRLSSEGTEATGAIYKKRMIRSIISLRAVLSAFDINQKCLHESVKLYFNGDWVDCWWLNWIWEES